MHTEKWYAINATLENVLTYTYDAAGRVLTAADYDGTYTMTYDGRGQVKTVTDPWGITLTFTYDDAGRRTKVEDSLGGVTTSVYDERGQLQEREFDDGGTYLQVVLGYTARNELGTIERSSGAPELLTTSYTYDEAGRITGIAHEYDASALGGFSYAWDNGGRLTSEAISGGATTTYAYDNAGQLTGDGTATYTYDAAGNREDDDYDTGAGNQLETDGEWTYSYDEEGNLTKKTKGAEQETWFYGYDQHNQLIWVEQRAEDDPESALQMRADYKYNVFGLRIEKAVDEDGDEDVDLTERYSYDGWKTGPQGKFVGTENWDVLFDLDGSSSLTTRYLRGDIVDQVFARIDASVAWLLGDQLGSVRYVVDAEGTVKDALTYDGFGNIVNETDALFRGRYTLAGRELDAETGHLYNRARYYDPRIGKWITRDPLGFDAGDSNLYRYVKNCADYITDPSGLHVFGYDRTPESADKSVAKWQKWFANVETVVVKSALDSTHWMLLPKTPADALLAEQLANTVKSERGGVRPATAARILKALGSETAHYGIAWGGAGYYQTELGELEKFRGDELFEAFAKLNGKKVNAKFLELWKAGGPNTLFITGLTDNNVFTKVLPALPKGTVTANPPWSFIPR